MRRARHSFATGARAGGRHRRGAATVEYVVVTLLAVIVLLASPSVIVEIIDAVKEMYAAFTFALGLTYPNPEDLLGG